MTPQTVARLVHVQGHVQGVFFRDTCRREAALNGVSGWIRNDPDGSVTACFEGSPDAVDLLVAWCRRGPSHARVDRVEVTEESPTGRRGFDVTG